MVMKKRELDLLDEEIREGYVIVYSHTVPEAPTSPQMDFPRNSIGLNAN